MILSNFLWMPKKDIAHLASIKNRLTVYSKFDTDDRIETFIETDEYLGIPRNYIDVPEDVDDQTILPEKIDIEFKGDLRPIQENMINDWRKLYDAGINDWILKGDTGVGKTIIMIKIACELKVPFLVIVPLERLMTYWIDQIKKFTNIKEVGIVQQNVCQYEGYAASVGMVHSLCKDKYPEEFKDYFGLIILDECHSTAATQFSKVLPMFKARHRIGASATLQRQDGMEKVYYYHLGRNVITSEKKTQPNPSVFVYEYEKLSGKYPVWLDRYDAIKVRAYLLSLMARNKQRNRLISDFAHTLIEKGIQTLVIGDRIAQLEEIQKYLIEMGHDDTGLYIGKTPDKEKKWIEKNASCILATLKMLEIGIDIDTLRGLVFATPKSEVKQVAGRIRRINPTVPEPIIVDIVDLAHKEAVRWYEKRKAFYEEENFPIKHIGG